MKLINQQFLLFNKIFTNKIIKFSLLSVFSLNFYCSQVKAQTIPDKTLGTESSTVNVIDENNTRIDNGAIRKTNLFHSFQEFSINEGKGVYFSNPAGVERIFFRVTGSKTSEILGRLGVLGNADLFFLNPNGIKFGPRASLELNGSFLATTASSILFADGKHFSALEKYNNQSLLTVNVPIGLSFYQNAINVEVVGNGHNLLLSTLFPTSLFPANSFLRVKPGENLAIIGGNILFDGGVVEGTNLILAGIKKGELFFDTSGSSWSFDFSQVKQRGNIKLSESSAADASGFEASLINLYGKDIRIDSGSILLMQNQQGGGEITISSESLILQGWKESGILFPPDLENLRASSDSIVFDLETEKIRGGFINGLPLLPGQKLDDVLSQFGLKRELMQFTITFNPSTILNESLANLGGKINLDVNTIKILNGANINLRNFVNSKGGVISINSRDLEISEFINEPGNEQRGFAIFSSINSTNFSINTGANIWINATNINAFKGGNISASTLNSGASGNVNINAEKITLSEIIPNIFIQSAIDTSSLSSGDAGSVKIDTAQLFIRDGAGIDANISASGNSGQVIINATDLIDIKGFSNSSDFSVSAINSSALIVPENLIEVFSLPSLPSGESGKVIINTPNLIISEFGQIGVRNEGTGNAGNLVINADNINLNNGGISATTASGKGGNIIIISDNLNLNNSVISSTAGGSGNGGNININSDLVILQKSEIAANAFLGNGGNIQINTPGFLTSPNSLITASSQFGLDGNVEINTNINDLRKVFATGRQVFLPEESSNINSCEIQLFSKGQGFNSHRDFPKQDNIQDYSDFVSLTVVELPFDVPYISEEIDFSPQLEQPGMPIIAATTVAKTKDGKIVFVNEARLIEQNLQKFPRIPDFCFF